MLFKSLFDDVVEYWCMVRKKKRSVKKGEFVQCYRNLNKPDFFSIVALRGKNKNKVVSYAQCIILKTPSFIVNQAGRKRACLEGTRNVHAFVRGYLFDMTNHGSGTVASGAIRISYNPFKYPYFFELNSEREIEKSDMREYVMLQGSYAYMFGRPMNNGTEIGNP